MAITFDGQARTITLSTPGEISVRNVWSDYVDWLAVGDNSKHFPMLATVGMDSEDIPLYLFLEDSVIFVVLDNSAPTVFYDGTIKTYDGHEPFGGAVVNVRYRDPGIAIGYSTTGTSGQSAESIAAAVVSALQGTTIPVDARLMNGAPVVGDGSELNPWRGVGVSP